MDQQSTQLKRQARTPNLIGHLSPEDELERLWLSGPCRFLFGGIEHAPPQVQGMGVSDGPMGRSR